MIIRPAFKEKSQTGTKDYKNENTQKKPLLKWAGGKRWLVPILNEIWLPFKTEPRLVEPFIGGMSVALGLSPKKALLNDINKHLINFYIQVKKGLIIPYKFNNKSKDYYQHRENFNDLIRQNNWENAEAAAMFYFLIRTGFNGLCRFNNTGEFNVPFGQHKSVSYKTNFSDYQAIFNPWQFRVGDFEQLKLKISDFLYADPPYDVEFTKYYQSDFQWQDQLRLAEWLAKHRGPVIASNQATDRIIELYTDLKFKLFIVNAPRSISCTGDRQPAKEMLAVKNLDGHIVNKIKKKIDAGKIVS